MPRLLTVKLITSMAFYQFLQSLMMLSPGFATCQSEPPGHSHDALVESGSGSSVAVSEREIESLSKLNSCNHESQHTGRQTSRPAGLTSGRGVVVSAAALLPRHTHAVLQDHVTRTTAGLTAPEGFQANCVAMEIGAGARAGFPTRPFFLATSTFCRWQGCKICSKVLWIGITVKQSKYKMCGGI